MPRVRRNGGGGNASSNPDRKVPKGSSHLRSRADVKRLNMYKSGAPIRDRRGKIVGGDLLSSSRTGNKPMEKMARVAPNRRWFGNTRVVAQKDLDDFRDKMSATVRDPYAVLLQRRAIPMGLLAEAKRASRVDLLSSEGYEEVFGPKKRRKRPKLGSSSLGELVAKASESAEKFEAAEEQGGRLGLGLDAPEMAREDIFMKGQSKRIWQELYKVLDCSDVVIQVLDARDPLGTRSKRVEKHIRENAAHKHLVFVLNKVDLVPTWVTKTWVRVLSEEFPTLAFHASIEKPFGKGALIQLLRQFAVLHPEKKQISVGFIGYPNSGKSSIINTLRSKKVCKVAPIPGETKIWQYITLFKRVFLIDCPGVVYPSGDSEADIVMKGVVRAEKLESPEDYIPQILERIKPEYIARTYGVSDWRDAEDFLSKLAKKRGRMLKGGEPDLRSVAQRVIFDLQRGRIPYFIPPPKDPESEQQSSKEENSREDVADSNENVEDQSEDKQAKEKKALAVPEQDFESLPQSDFAQILKKSAGANTDEEEKSARPKQSNVAWNDLDL